MNQKRGLLRIARNFFVAGLLIVVPIVITAQALWFLFGVVDNIARPWIAHLIQREIPGVGVVTMLVVVFSTGVLFSAGPLRRLLDSLEEVIEYIPIVGVVYATIKKVFAGFGSMRSSKAFKRFVLARLPGRTTPGFLTGSFTLRRVDGQTHKLCTVYVPTNHLYVGDIVVVPSENVIETELSVEDGISIILSAGAAVPDTVGEASTSTARVNWSAADGRLQG